MTFVWLTLAILTGLALVYVIAGRDRLKRLPLLTGFFAWFEPYEIRFWSKSETIFKARFMQCVGLLLSFLTFIHSQDLTALMPFLPTWAQLLMPMMPLVINLLSALDEYLRKSTTKPIEVVAVPDANAPPEVQAAVVLVEVANENAVSAVANAKAAKEM